MKKLILLFYVIFLTHVAYASDGEINATATFIDMTNLPKDHVRYEEYKFIISTSTPNRFPFRIICHKTDKPSIKNCYKKRKEIIKANSFILR